MTAEELKREFAEKWGGCYLIQKDIDTCLSDLNALISENYYPKEFLDWAAENCRCEGSGLWYCNWDAKAEQFKKTFTTDELFNYWKENEQ